jgi:chondroitin AC lyase
MAKPLLLALTLLCPFAHSFDLPPTGPETIPATATRSSAVSDVALVRSRYVLSMLSVDSSAFEQLNAKSAKYAATLQPDGRWPDIDYKSTVLTDWATSEHLQRTLVMEKAARLYCNGGHTNDALESKALAALKAWTTHDYQNPNWWWNEIGVPELIGEIANLMWPHIPSDELLKVTKIMRRSDWHRVPRTGANLTWEVIIEIARGCLENSPDLVGEGYERMYKEIRIVSTSEDGIQQDYSFHQHKAQIHSGGYGLNFADDVGRFVSFAWGTRFQLPPDGMAIFSSYLLDGEQWFVRGNIIDYSTVGRSITRRGNIVVPHDPSARPMFSSGPAYILGNAVALLAAEPTPRRRELLDFAARLSGKAGTPDFIGNKQFWCSDFMAHRRRGFYTSVKLLSARTLNGELIDGEGIKSQHLSDGVNLLYLTGNEYTDIFPVWDWTKLPGTTAIQETLETGETDPIAARGITTFDGGVSDGVYGMAAMDLARGSLSAKKAWFFFDNSYVALGSGITLRGNSGRDVITDVNQPLLAGNVFTSLTLHRIPAGTFTYNSANTVWVYHNHVGYIFSPNTRMFLSIGPQSGKWSDIGTGSNQPITLSVFDLWIDHGRSPQNATYQYIVLPNVCKRHFLAALFWGCSGFKLDSWWLCGHGGLGWMKG